MNFKFAILITLACLATSQATSSKITKRLQESLTATKDAKVNIFVSVQEGIHKALASVTHEFKSRASRSTAVYNALTKNAEQTQKEVIALLDTVVAKDSSIKVKSFWITNQVYIQGANRDLVDELSELEQVSKIDEEAIHYIDPPVESIPVPKRDVSINAPEWHLNKIQTVEVWEAPWGSNGTGVIVGVIDTGVRASHEAIRDRYVNDGHAWRDPYNQYRIPTDIYDHGTHVAGSVVGRDGIGIAPEARFNACKGYRDDGSALVSAFFECGQFLVCPTDVDGNNADCTKSVHVAQNSWGLSLGGGDYKQVLDVWYAARIMPIFANGNYGPTCNIVYSPADNIGAIGVGATDSNDRLASFSGRGPSEFRVLKPDYSAPGVSIYSCDRRSDSSYSVKSGTSMASPVAAGAAALMVGAKRDVTYEQLKDAFETTASRNVPALGETCGGVSDSVWPNNHYGHGRINVYAAVRRVLGLN